MDIYLSNILANLTNLSWSVFPQMNYVQRLSVNLLRYYFLQKFAVNIITEVTDFGTNTSVLICIITLITVTIFLRSVFHQGSGLVMGG